MDPLASATVLKDISGFPIKPNVFATAHQKSSLTAPVLMTSPISVPVSASPTLNGKIRMETMLLITVQESVTKPQSLLWPMQP